MIKIDSEFQNLIPPLTADEYNALEQNIIKDGCRDALVLWGDILVDGHNRYKICTKHNIPFKTVQKDFADRNEAMLWMMQNQLARRNLNDAQRIEIVRKCEGAIRAKAKEQQIRKPAESVMEKFPEQKPIVARDALGSMAGVSGKTYEHAVVVLDNAPAPVADAMRRDELSIHAAYQVTQLEPEEQEEIAQRIEHIQDEPEETRTVKAIVQEVKNKPHVANNSGNNEWYTPARYIELARKVMGEIDVDPASCEFANRTVKAKSYYTIDTDGLSHEWRGRVWLNPPYSGDLVGRFVDKLLTEYDFGRVTEAVVLVNNATETGWFCSLAEYASAVVFGKGRVRYESVNGVMNTPLQGQAFVYLGENTDKFLKVFESIGWGVRVDNG